MRTFCWHREHNTNPKKTLEKGRGGTMNGNEVKINKKWIMGS